MPICYLLGAGFSYAISNKSIPLTKDLGEKLAPHVPEVLKDRYDYNPAHLERFLTHLDLKIAASPTGYEVAIRKEIQSFLLDELSLSSIKETDDLNLYDLGKKFVKKLKPFDVILTLNYDCLLDALLYKSGRWDYEKGYSAHIFNFPKILTENRDSILLLKLHGSTNFWEHAVCTDRDIDWSQSEFIIEIKNGTFPFFYSHSQLGGSGSTRKGQYIIAPSYLKQFNSRLMRLWNLAMEKLREAEKLVIIGCSLRNEDTELSQLLMEFKGSVVDIIDPKNEDIKKRLQDIIPKIQPTLYQNLVEWLNSI